MYNYSARRKQGLGSLRPGYFSGGGIDLVPMLLGNVINWGAPKVWDYATKSKEQREEEVGRVRQQFDSLVSGLSHRV